MEIVADKACAESELHAWKIQPRKFQEKSKCRAEIIIENIIENFIEYFIENFKNIFENFVGK